MNGREPFGYVVAVSGTKVTLNLLDAYRGHFASHRGGISSVTEVGQLFGLDDGARTLILRVRSLSFLEPREAHRAGVGSTSLRGQPLRHLEAVVLGSLSRTQNGLRFEPDSLLSPALGAAATALRPEESRAILRRSEHGGQTLSLGTDVRGGGELTVPASTLLPRHVAVLGSTGQGKSCLTAAVMQQLVRLPGARIVVFDMNGEYEQAIRPHTKEGDLRISVLGGPAANLTIPYVALGRHGLERLLLPSERTQRPALTFALESLPYVRWFPGTDGVGLACDSTASLFDDCRPDPDPQAGVAIQQLRAGGQELASEWPHMRALACLAAESYCLQQGRLGLERNGFHYGHVSPLVTRIRRYTEDPLFRSVVEVEGGPPTTSGGMSWSSEATHLLDQIFGSKGATWKVHIVNLRNIAHDLLPMLLGALLELLAFEMFKRGQGNTHPTLLVLEEAHHYLRQIATGEDGAHQMLAYERLAKEGRKFGVALWLGTQRPAEISPTVLAQCGTWAVFRLTAEQDLRAVAAAGEWFDRQELDRIAGLPRQQAVVFGDSVHIPVRVIAPVADPVPESEDPEFGVWEDPHPTAENDPEDHAPTETGSKAESEIVGQAEGATSSRAGRPPNGGTPPPAPGCDDIPF